MSYTSATQRLLQIPEVFTGSDLTILCGWTSAIASSYLAQWRKAGLVRSLGGRSDVHMNLVRNRHVHPDLALRRAFPHALKVGVDVLRDAGWTTQIPTLTEVAVPTGSSLYTLSGYALGTRTAIWFQVVAPGITQVAQGISSLQPAWALADMLARAQDRRIRHAWLLDPEDIDLHAARQDKDSALALQALGLGVKALQDAGYEEAYSTWFNRAKP
nr:hypothetical protein [uncultured Albidiferax sp.]